MGKYPISLASTAIAKKPLFGIAIAKDSVNGVNWWADIPQISNVILSS